MTNKIPNIKKSEILENILNKSPAVAFLWSNEPNWPVLYVSENIEQFGYSQEDFYSGQILFADIIYPEDLEKVAKEVYEYSKTGTDEFEQQYRIITSFGDIRWISDYTWVKRTKKDKITNYQGVILDITEQVETTNLLKESEEKYRHLFEHSPYSVILLNHKAEIVDCNATVKNIFGFHREELIGKDYLDVPIFSDTDIIRLKRRQKMLTQSRHLKPVDVEITKKDGSKAWITSKNSHIKIGNSQYIQILVQDITEKKQSEQIIKEALEFEKIVSTISSRFVNVTDLGEAINKTLSDLTKYTHADHTFMCIQGNLKFINSFYEHSYENNSVIDLYRKLKKTDWWSKSLLENKYLYIPNIKKADIPKNIKKQFKKYHKNSINSVLIYPLRLNENFIGCVGFDKIEAENLWHEEAFALLRIFSEILLNTIERKKVETALSESESRFRLITEQNLMGILILQEDLFKYVNKAVEKITSYNLENWKLTDISQIIHEDDFDFTLEQARKKQLGVKNGIITNYSYRIRRKDGEIRWIDQYSKTVNYRGKTADLITIIDITDRKHFEEELKKSNNRYLDAYNRANFYKDIFAHDMNNILHNIRSSLDLYNLYKQTEMKPKELEDLMEIINLQVRRGEKLISNVQKLSQIQEEDIILEKVNINEYLEKALDFLQNSFKNKDINVSINSFKKKIFVEANELLLDVFENILINAVKYNQNSTIRIEIDINKTKKSKKSNIKIEFSDNGIGIPDGRKERIFERGYKNKSSVHGMGLGLSLVKNILDNYNAQIYVKDKDPQNYKNGSKFIILFPMLKRDN